MTQGLSQHPGTPAFLKRAYGVSFVAEESGMPLYRDAHNKLFWGGWGSFYTVCDSKKMINDAGALGKKYGLLEGCFSLPIDRFRARHVHPMLMIPQGTRAESRMDLYDGKTRNQTRRAREASLTLALTRGTIPTGWHDLYVETRERLGSKPNGHEYFAALEECFGESLRCVVARDGEKIVGSTLYIVHGDYVHLLENISQPAYWPQRVNNLVYDEMIRLAIEGGVRMIDFGLTGAHDGSHLDFKRGFGGVPRYIVSATFGNPVARMLDFARRAIRAALRRVIR
jgi:hypothetical protein